MTEKNPERSPFRPVDEVNHTPEREERVLAWWEERGIFAQSISEREGAPDYVFYEGPPTANGLPGVHHVQSRTFKDLVCRLKTMEGYRVLRKAGWDTHGLPVEIEVEKKLGLEHKAEIEAYGVGPFNEECRSSVRAYEEEWRTLTERIGFWIDLDDPYFTFSNDYIESVWWILSRFWEKDLVYQGFKILPYCPRCGTPLSSHEVSLGYDEAEDPSIYVRFPVTAPGSASRVFAEKPAGMPRSLLVWTTTPWTLISNTFAVVHAELEYAEVEVEAGRPYLHRKLDEKYGVGYSGEVYEASAEGEGRERLILASDRVEGLFGDPEGEGLVEGVEVVARFKGADLVGLGYQRPFTYVEMEGEKPHRVFADDYVTDEEGTGIVHSSPAYGEDDFRTGRREGMPVVTPVDDEGAFRDEVEPWAGRFVKDADPGIIRALASAGLLFRCELYSHTYPFCWRCETPLLYMARPSWYIRTTAIKEKLLSANRSIDWIPPEIGSGRMGEWLENNQDWSLSRDRYWGTPLPVWVCGEEECGHMECVGSVQELRERAEEEVSEDIDLHKPYVDGFTWGCPSCGEGTMERTPEVIDVWFDSGSMPYAQWHYPFENRKLFDRQFPGDFISEGIDQTRGWFYSLLAIGAILFDRPAYKHCLVTEMVLDKNGQKMSKSRGNAVDPWAIIDAWGVDPLRWYLITNSPPWLPTKFDEEGVAEASRRFFGTLHNTHAFFALYADVDAFDPRTAEEVPLSERPVLDRWVLSRLHGTARSVRRHLGRFDLTRAARQIQDFVIEDLSNWYVRRSRRRFWKGDPGREKTSAYRTLHEALVTTAGLLAPFVPFTAEELWQNLEAWREDAEESVHLSDYPAGEKERVDEDLDRAMGFVRDVVALGRAARNRTGVKVRQPLSRMSVVAPEAWQKQALEDLGDLVADEMNVKEIEAVESSTAFTERAAEPVFKALGPKFGERVNAAAEVIRSLTGEDLQRLERGEEVSVSADGEYFVIGPGEVRLEERESEGLAVEEESGRVVAVDTLLTDGLVKEGLAREFITRVQGLRKQLDYEVTDRVELGYEASPRLGEALEAHRAYVAEETLAVEVSEHPLSGADAAESWEIDGEEVTITITRAGGDRGTG
ncbi:MAG: isoleucine--tRNA ligase [bacterium]